MAVRREFCPSPSQARSPVAMGQLVTLLGSQACGLFLPKPCAKVEASRLVLWAADSSFSAFHLGGEGRPYTENELKAVGISFHQFLKVLECFWHWSKVF